MIVLDDGRVVHDDHDDGECYFLQLAFLVALAAFSLSRSFLIVLFRTGLHLFLNSGASGLCITDHFGIDSSRFRPLLFPLSHLCGPRAVVANCLDHATASTRLHWLLSHARGLAGRVVLWHLFPLPQCLLVL